MLPSGHVNPPPRRSISPRTACNNAVLPAPTLPVITVSPGGNFAVMPRRTRFDVPGQAKEASFSSNGESAGARISGLSSSCMNSSSLPTATEAGRTISHVLRPCSDQCLPLSITVIKFGTSCRLDWSMLKSDSAGKAMSTRRGRPASFVYAKNATTGNNP